MAKFCVAGLGNPGKKYENTRHNIGFLALDYIADNAPGFSAIDWKEKFDALIASWSVDGNEVVAVKPQSFMNLSGEPLQKVAHFYKLAVDHCIVVHDEIDLPFGQIRIKRGGGDAGHNGLKSISKMLGSKDYFRIRVGVGRPDSQSDDRKHLDVSDWVLSRFSSAEEKELGRIFESVSEATDLLMSKGLKDAQKEIHSRRL